SCLFYLYPLCLVLNILVYITTLVHISTLFPYTTLFRSRKLDRFEILSGDFLKNAGIVGIKYLLDISDAIENRDYGISEDNQAFRSEEHTSELQSRFDLVCRLLLEKKKKKKKKMTNQTSL